MSLDSRGSAPIMLLGASQIPSGFYSPSSPTCIRLSARTFQLSGLSEDMSKATLGSHEWLTARNKISLSRLYR